MGKFQLTSRWTEIFFYNCCNLAGCICCPFHLEKIFASVLARATTQLSPSPLYYTICSGLSSKSTDECKNISTISGLGKVKNQNKNFIFSCILNTKVILSTENRKILFPYVLRMKKRENSSR